MKKKTLKNFSKTFLLGFFVFQFAITPSLMPLVARAEEGTNSEASAEVSDSSKESKGSEASVDTEPQETSNENSDSDESLGDVIKDVVESAIDTVFGVSIEDASQEVREVAQALGGEGSGDELPDGTIEICKVIINANNEVVVGNEFAGETFSVKLKDNAGAPVRDFTFAAPLTNTTTFGDRDQYVMECQTENDLPYGTYVYAEEDTSGPTQWDVTYTETDINDPLAGQSYSYGDDLDSNGILVIGDSLPTENPNGSPRTSARVIVVNKFVSNDACDAPAVYARVNLTNLENSAVLKTNNGWYNTGNGNMAPKIYVGGTDSDTNENGGDVYDIGEWFLIYDSVNGYVNDPVLTSTDPGIDGLAIQRLDGQLRIVLYGSHAQPAGNQVLNREMAHGFIDFSNDQSTVSSDVEIVNQIVDAQNPLESNPNAPIDYPTNDYTSFTSTQSNFKFVVTTHNDGMYTVFTHTLPAEDCGGDPTNQAPTITANPVCLAANVESFDPMTGVSANDPENGNITDSVVVISNDLRLGTEGIYHIEYAVVDADGAAGELIRTITISKNCGGGGGHDPVAICHAAGQSGNYVFLTVDDDATYGGHGNHANDIIPITDVNGDNQIDQADCDDDGGGNGGSCDSGINLFTNGGFEKPVISNSNGWAIYTDGTAGLDWDVAWEAGSGDETIAKAELQKIYTANGGTQYIELDSDFDGPGGSISNEAASTRISQTITTVPGQKYEISYYYSARPGYGYEDNKVGLYIDGVAWDLSVTDTGIGDTDTVWKFRNVNTFTANDTSHTISFADLGTANSYGMFLDDVRVNCDDDNGGEEDNAPMIKVDPDTTCILTSATTYDFLNGVMAGDAEDGDLFESIIHDGETVVDFGTPGVYMVTYSVTDSDGNTTTATRTITIDEDCDNGGGGDGDSPVITVNTQSCVSNSAESYDFAAGASATDTEDGTVTVVIDSSAVIFGTAGSYDVTYTATDSDGNITTVTQSFNISANCGGTGGGDDDSPVITTPGQTCVLVSAETFDFMDGVTATDDEDGDLTASIVLNDEETVLFGTAGTYTVSYEVTDSNAQTTTVTRTINIAEDCDNGGGGNGGGGNGGGGNGGGSSSGSSSRRNNGEVLGASTCAQFTQYHDTGSTKSEVKALQTFLNEYMDAGLVVSGTYDWATTNAVHQFQALHWNEIIAPWLPAPSEISPNTTGRTRQTTMSTMNFLIGCPNEALYLEDPQTMYEVTSVGNARAFTEDQTAEIISLLDQAHAGQVLGVEEMGK